MVVNGEIAGSQARPRRAVRFFTAQANTFAGVNVKERALACSVQNDNAGRPDLKVGHYNGGRTEHRQE